ncbi:MAG: hypothetical protein H7A23_21305 [Leptospiraceae bacterium]|nr:hypothetical protein [Leptospiraceae bacterium]MCP5497100.1 hypothetical protein [Leptospiraceae bacterium]
MMYKLFIAFTIVQFSVFAETIILRNGKIIKGQVLGHDSDSVKINREDGRVQTIPKSNVYKVVFASNSTEIHKIQLEKEKKRLIQYSHKLKSSNSMKDRYPTGVDREQLIQTITKLEERIGKLEKKISQLRMKISKLKRK